MAALFGALLGRGPTFAKSGRRGLNMTIVGHYRRLVREMDCDPRAWHTKAADRSHWRDLIAHLHYKKHQYGLTRNEVRRESHADKSCSVCGFEAVSASGLTRHVLARHGLFQDSVCCTHCDRSFPSRAALSRHRCHLDPQRLEEILPGTDDPAPPPPPPAAAPLSCGRCYKIFNTKGRYNEHMNGRCPMIDVPLEYTVADCRVGSAWRCPACRKILQQPGAFKCHWKRCRERPEVRLEIAPPQSLVRDMLHFCCHCGKGWAWPSELQRHEERCSAQVPP